MAVNHDFRCDNPECDTQYFDALFDLAQQDPLTGDFSGPPCPTCHGSTIRVILPPRTQWRCDAVVVYRAPDGSFRFPGAIDGASTAKYDRAGYERIEARSAAEVRHLEKRLNAHESSQLARANERRAAHIEQIEGQRRSATRDGMNQGFYIPETRLEVRGGKEQVVHTGRRIFVPPTTRLRDRLRATMSRNDAKGHRRIGEPGLHVDVMSNDRSSRDESRRSDGKKFHD